MLREWTTLLRLARTRFLSDAHYRRFQAHQGHLILRYLEKQGVRIQGTKVLDLGCGRGGYSQSMQRAGAHVVSMDLTRPDAVPPAFLVGDALRLPLASNSFPLVFCASLIEHVAQPAQLVAEIKRILAPQGIAYLSFPPFYTPVGGHQFKPYHLLGERLALRLSKQRVESYATSFGDHGLYPLTIRRVRRLLSQANLTIKHEATRFLPINVSRIPVLGEFLTWHVQFLLCKEPASVRHGREPSPAKGSEAAPTRSLPLGSSTHPDGPPASCRHKDGEVEGNVAQSIETSWMLS